MAKSPRELGEVNRHQQKLIAKIADSDSDHGQLLWVVECQRPDGGRLCHYRYGSNGVDFFQRKCPVCQGGQPGPSIAGIAYE